MEVLEIVAKASTKSLLLNIVYMQDQERGSQHKFGCLKSCSEGVSDSRQGVILAKNI